MTKRAFFKRFGGLIAALAIAPEIAFNAKLPAVELEWPPWQDHLSNMLTQMLLTAKQNLANIYIQE